MSQTFYAAKFILTTYYIKMCKSGQQQTGQKAKANVLSG